MVDAVVGVADLVKNFKSLDQDIQTKTGRRMVASAAGVIKRQAKQNVMSRGLVRTKALLNNIVVKRETKAPANTIQYNVGVRHGRTLTRKQKQNSKVILKRANGRIRVFRQNDPYYWRFVHFGHKTVVPASGSGTTVKRKYQTTLKNGKKVWRTAESNSQSLRNRRRATTGNVAPEPFLSDAAEQKFKEAIAQMGKVLKSTLDKAGK